MKEKIGYGDEVFLFFIIGIRDKIAFNISIFYFCKYESKG